MRRIPFFLIILFTICHTSCVTQAQKINGLSYVASGDSITRVNVLPVLKTNSNYVSLMPFAFVRGIHHPEVIFDFSRQWFGESDKGVIQYATQFQAEGIKVMIKPQIWVSRGEFTGDIVMQNEADWLRFEETYENYILTFAKIAQKINADMLCVGTELKLFVSQRPIFWKSLIRKVKEVYDGPLTYAANWDEYKRIAIWEDLDYIGIDAYFPVSDAQSPTVADFENGWQRHKAEIKSIQSKFNKPILFTEFGYRSVNFAGEKPWESNRIQGQVNLQAQVNGLQALYNQFWNEDWFAGGFVWKWFVKHEKVGGLQNNRFTPQNKPAEDLLRKLYAN